jgi:hypothetical protein
MTLLDRDRLETELTLWRQTFLLRDVIVEQLHHELEESLRRFSLALELREDAARELDQIVSALIQS